MNLNRINAIFIKELQEMRTNTNVSIMYLIPVLFAALYEFVIPDMPAGMGVAFGLIFLVVLIGMYAPSMMIAEEKEKKTLDVLMFSPARPSEIFIGKGLLTLVLMLVISVIIIIIGGSIFAHKEVLMVGMLLTSIFAITLGMIVGLLSPNQMATGVVGLPLYLLLLLIPMLSAISPVLTNVAKLLPTYHFLEMIELASKSGNLLDMGWNIGALVLSIVVSFTLLLVVYRKKGFGK